MFLCVQQGDGQMFLAMADLGAKLDVRNENGESLLHCIGKRKNDANDFAHYIDKIIQSGVAVDCLDKNGDSPIIICLGHNKNLLDNFLRAGASIDQVNSEGENLLEIALYHKCEIQACLSLIHEGLKVDQSMNTECILQHGGLSCII